MSTQPREEPRELVEVYDTQSDAEAQMVKSLLESNGIEALISGLDAPQEILPGVGGVIVRVHPESADEARRIISEQLQGLPETGGKDPEETEA